MTAKLSTKSEKWPCFFYVKEVTKITDDVVQGNWKAMMGTGAPFAALRGIWRREHCMRLNPYGSADCPYKPGECGIAFAAVARTATTAKEDPKAYFSKIARGAAARRADNKPLARTQASQVQLERNAAQGPGDPATTNEGVPAGQGLPGTSAGPQRIGELLGHTDFGSHQNRSTNGEESTK